MKTIWEKNCDIAMQKELQDTLNVETVVIGAGMAGILTAYFLKKKGHSAVVVETKRLGSGQTKGTTAKITSQHGLCYHQMIQKVGRGKAECYARANEAAINLYRQLIEEEEIDCEFQSCNSYLYTRREADRATLQKESVAAVSLGIKAYFVEKEELEELPFSVCGGVCFENQAQFHPLKFVKHLVKGLTIYENTKVLKVKGHMVYTNRGNICAENIIFTTHYPLANTPGFYFLRQHQERSYVLALKAQKELKGMYYGIDENGLSLRGVGDTILLSGAGHRTGKNRGGCYGYLRKMGQLYYPKAEEVAAWSAQDCIPHDGIPFIGKYSVFRPYWYVASGFHKWGMTASMIAAESISGHITGERLMPKNMVEIFSPQRMLVRVSVKNLVIDMGESIKGLVKGLLGSKKKRCPHMGCGLKWNPEENSWDCPCHGSRFGYDGELKDNPAKRDLKK